MKKDFQMKKIITLAAIAAACSTSAFAQVSNFTGPSIGAGIDFKSTTLEVSGGGMEFSGLGSQNIIGTVSGDYGFALSNTSVVLVGAKFDLSKTQIAKASGGGSSVTLEESDHYSVFVAPSMLLNDKTLAYAKLSLETAKYGLDKGGDTKETGHGVGYGVGIRTHITGNWFANVEAGRIAYNSKDAGSASMKTGSTVASFGISYKF
jgi:opacity protein-like surface antigen